MTTTVSIAVKTIDRSVKGKRNYLGDTLRNLHRGGVFDSRHLHSLTLVDGGSGFRSSTSLAEFLEEDVGRLTDDATCHPYVAPHLSIPVDSPPPGTCRNYHRNAVRALYLAGSTSADWSMVIEDDIDVCADFLESVVAWLSDHAISSPTLYAFGANYQQIRQAFADGRSSWAYPCHAFYGALCCVWRPSDALDIVEWYGEDPSYVNKDGDRVYDAGHDLMLGRWGQDRGLTHFIASVPCFIDHIGLESGLDNRPIQYAGFGGREYSYMPSTGGSSVPDLPVEAINV